jgi:hypothetical protein
MVLGVVASASLASGTPGAATTVAQLLKTANVLPGLSQATLLGPAAASTRLTVDIGLSADNSAAKSAALSTLYNPSSSNYHRFLTPAQYDATFGVSASTVAATTAWLRTDGLTPSYISGAGDLIAVQGSVSQLSDLLHTTFGSYRIGSYSFVANQRPPEIPADLPITDVAGLNTLQRMWTESEIGGLPVTAGPKVATAPTSYIGTDVAQDLWGVYDAPTSDQGQGETAGMFGAGYSNSVVSDLRVFDLRMGLPPVPVRIVNEDQVTSPPVPNDNDLLGEGEWNLDTQAIDGMAPSLSKLDLYFASTPLDADSAVMFDTWANDPAGPKQMDASFGECESDPASPLEKNLPPLLVGQGAIGNQLQLLADPSLEQAVLEGRTLFTSAGDTAGSCPAVILPVLSAGNGVIPQPLPFDQNYPCVSIYAVCVGGTVVTTNGTTNVAATGAPATAATTTPARVAEQAWIFTGGGPAANVPRPSYQEGVSAIGKPCTELSGPGGAIPLGTICRGVPDVAAISGSGLIDGVLLGNNGYLVNEDMIPSPVGGTSLSSPVTVGLWARIQAASPPAANGVYGGLGFANDTFYAVGKGTLGNASRDFYDVTSAELPTGNFYELAHRGWDYTTGWGAIDAANFIRDVDHDPTLTPTHPSPTPDPESFFPAVACSVTISSPAGNALDPNISLVSPFVNDPSLDITSATLAPNAQGTALVATISGPALSTHGPLDALGGFSFLMAWTYLGVTYFAGAEVDPPIPNVPAAISLPTGRVVYGDGNLTKSGTTFVHSDSGTFANHTFTITVPLGNVGNPGAGSLLLYPFAFDTLPIAVFSADATDAATASKPGEAVELGPHC